MDLSNETMIHVKKGDIEYLQFRRLLQYEDKLSHCISLIGNGNSYRINDGTNYKNLVEAIGLKEESLMTIKDQVHSNFVEPVENTDKRHAEIDGLITNKRGITLSTREADCTPILFYDPVKEAIGNVHSGWRGTVGRIAKNAIRKMMEEYGCRPSDILCFIGPCIQACHFKVGEDVKDIFEESFEYQHHPERIQKGEIELGEQKYYIDATAINKQLLEEMGVLPENIVDSKICTVCHSDEIHSYRASKSELGRNTTLIGMK